MASALQAGRASKQMTQSSSFAAILCGPRLKVALEKGAAGLGDSGGRKVWEGNLKACEDPKSLGAAYGMKRESLFEESKKVAADIGYGPSIT